VENDTFGALADRAIFWPITILASSDEPTPPSALLTRRVYPSMSQPHRLARHAPLPTLDGVRTAQPTLAVDRCFGLRSASATRTGLTIIAGPNAPLPTLLIEEAGWRVSSEGNPGRCLLVEVDGCTSRPKKPPLLSSLHHGPFPLQAGTLTHELPPCNMARPITLPRRVQLDYASSSIQSPALDNIGLSNNSVRLWLRLAGHLPRSSGVDTSHTRRRQHRRLRISGARKLTNSTYGILWHQHESQGQDGLLRERIFDACQVTWRQEAQMRPAPNDSSSFRSPNHNSRASSP
ncbi:hypothetical protein LX36DRAFT_675953, partial [Colletotrichum falcatum]